MEASRFDRLTKSLSTGSTRRGLVRLIAVFPLVGSLAGLLGAEETVAKRPVAPAARTPQTATAQARNGHVSPIRVVESGCRHVSATSTSAGLMVR
jgi:hypothetical protein